MSSLHVVTKRPLNCFVLLIGLPILIISVYSLCSIRVGLHSWSRYGPDWTHIGFSFILLTVNRFGHPTLIEHGLYQI